MKCRTEGGETYRQYFNAENRLWVVKHVDGNCTVLGNTLEQWVFVYDGDGVRVKEVYTDFEETPAEVVTKRYYFGGAYETVAETSTAIKYYRFAGQMIATNDGSGLKYFLSDHLGSMSAVLDSTGTLISEQRYLPFGGVRVDFNDPIVETDYGYTGQRVTGMGLMDYRARMYSVYLNRWIQPDSIVPDPGISQAWNRYAYVVNNPIIYNDPSGHCPWCVGTALIGAAVGVLTYTWNVSRSGQDWNMGEAVTVGIVGAGAGALIGTGIGAGVGTAAFSAIATSAGVGMGSSAAGHMIMNGITRTEFNSTDFAIATAVGGATGALGQAGAATTMIGSMALEGGAGVIQYGATEFANDRWPTIEGVAWSGASGMIGGAISGPYTPIDNLTVSGPSDIGFDLDKPEFRPMWQEAIKNSAARNMGRSSAVTFINNFPQPKSERLFSFLNGIK